MIDVNVSISGIIMCCDESLCGLNLGRGYTIEKCNLDTLFFKDKITNDEDIWILTILDHVLLKMKVYFLSV